MVVCQYFLRGQCKFGDSCRNEHPRNSPHHTNQSWHSGQGNTQAKSGSGPLFSVESISKDLTPQLDKPIWPLSSYAPAKYDPILIPNLDESPEELRLRAVTAIQTGAVNDYLKYESDKILAAEQIYANARSNIAQAYNQAIKQSLSSAGQSAPDTNTTAATGSAFGGATSAFGRPSGFGAFGNSTSTPSAFGGASGSAFSSTNAPSSAFGQPSFGQSAFSQTAAPASTSAFGQPTQPTSAFGQTSLPQSSLIKPASGAFGATGGGAFASTPSAFSNAAGGMAGGGGGFSSFSGSPSAFGTGALANNASVPSGSVFGQSAFGNPSAPTVSVFGAPAPTQGSAFGAPSAFGALAQQQPGTTSAFGGSAFNSNPNPSGYVFGPGGGAAGPFSNNSNLVASPFASQPTSAFAPVQPSSSGIVSQQPISSFASQQPGSSLPAKAQPDLPDFLNTKSTYKPGVDGYDSLLPDNYTELVPKTMLEAFQSPKFEWGKIPDWIPPKELR